ncbi:MAG: hypothetical protein PHS04_15175 [Tissierellia bacterium]|jgi:hypothetical protein|nr:hypothetical protein [Tissierellia bacterium]
MFINETIIELAKKAIDESQSQFIINDTLVFYVTPESELEYQVGYMPSYFNYEKNGEIKRFVIYKKPNK